MFKVTLDRDTDKVLCLILARDVENIADLRNNVLSGNLECSIINPALIPDPLITAIAANRAVLAERSGKLKTKTLHSELLFNLSPSKNITQSLQTFGIRENAQQCIFAIIQDAKEDKAEKLLEAIKGVILEVTELNNLADAELIRKTYKITDEELKISSLADATASRIATKEIGIA